MSFCTDEKPTLAEILLRYMEKARVRVQLDCILHSYETSEGIRGRLNSDSFMEIFGLQPFLSN